MQVKIDDIRDVQFGKIDDIRDVQFGFKETSADR